ncbi:MAG: hypothetical protein M1827_006133 [Pycnora praestabilis]|nr:MAG: hypothetical protein M1827_006133 [Pycnora praestabilis]
MSGKLDQSLDEILSTRRNAARGRGAGRGRGRPRRAPNPVKSNGASVAAPVGGVKKNTKPARGSGKAAVPTGPAGRSGEGKIMVSNLPPDVNEAQIKEYFAKAVGPVKKAMIAYDSFGKHRGVATVIFHKASSATDALSQHGLLVDEKPMRIEVVYDASQAPPPAPVKGLGERIAQPKSQPKPATAAKAATNGTRGASTRGGTERGRGAKRGRNAGRAKPKTAEELDAEMVDYFDANATNGNASAGTDPAAATTNGAQAAATSGGADAGMDDEIL